MLVGFPAVEIQASVPVMQRANGDGCLLPLTVNMRGGDADDRQGDWGRLVKLTGWPLTFPLASTKAQQGGTPDCKNTTRNDK